MRGDVVTAFMDGFGEIVYNNYNASTETGMVTIAKPEDLRAAPIPQENQWPAPRFRILDDLYREVGTGGSVKKSALHPATLRSTASPPVRPKLSHAGFHGDRRWYLDAAGRLFVVGRDDEMIVSGVKTFTPLRSIAADRPSRRNRGECHRR